jgi:O-antigen/teichoic acid export membrane protein
MIPPVPTTLSEESADRLVSVEPRNEAEQGEVTDSRDSLHRLVRRVTGGTIGNLFAQAINVAGQFVLVPIFLTHWGNQLYGEWLTLSAAVTYLTLVDFGIQSYVINRMNQCYARGELETCTRILHSALYVYLLISAGAALLMFSGLWLLPLPSWLQFTITKPATTIVVGTLLTLQILAAVPTGVITGIYRAVREYPREMMIGNTIRLGSLVLTAIVVAAGGTLASVPLVHIVMLVVGMLYVWTDLRRRHPEIHIGLSRADFKEATLLLAPSSLFFLIQIATVVVVQGSTLVVSATLGAGSVAIFATLRTLANLLKQGSFSIYNALWPEFTALEARGKYQALGNIHLLTAKVVLIFNVSLAIFLYFTAAQVIKFWTQDRIVYDSRLMLGLLLFQLSQAWWMISSLLLAASNNHKSLSLSQFAASCCGLSLGFVLGSKFGVAGVIYGLLAADILICGLIIPWAACRMLRKSFAFFVAEVLLRGIPVFAVLYIAADWTFSGLPALNLAQFVISGLGFLLLGFALGYLLWLNRSEKARLRTFLAPALLAGTD